MSFRNRLLKTIDFQRLSFAKATAYIKAGGLELEVKNIIDCALADNFADSSFTHAMLLSADYEAVKRAIKSLCFIAPDANVQILRADLQPDLTWSLDISVRSGSVASGHNTIIYKGVQTLPVINPHFVILDEMVRDNCWDRLPAVIGGQCMTPEALTVYLATNNKEIGRRAAECKTEGSAIDVIYIIPSELPITEEAVKRVLEPFRPFFTNNVRVGDTYDCPAAVCKQVAEWLGIAQ